MSARRLLSLRRCLCSGRRHGRQYLPQDPSDRSPCRYRLLRHGPIRYGVRNRRLRVRRPLLRHPDLRRPLLRHADLRRLRIYCLRIGRLRVRHLHVRRLQTLGSAPAGHPLRSRWNSLHPRKSLLDCSFSCYQLPCAVSLPDLQSNDFS